MGKRKEYRFPKSILESNGMKHLYRQTPPNYDYNDNEDFESAHLNQADMPSPTDYWGSYTGVPMDGTDRPIQDADDL